MKKIFLVTVFVLFSSISFAEISTDWKWGKVFNSVVLISGENVAETIPKSPDVAPHEKEQKFDSFKPKVIPYGMGTGFFINKVHIVTNYHVIKNFDSIKIYAYDHPFEISDIKIIGYDEEIDIAVIEVNEDIPHDYIKWADKVPYIGDRVYALGHGMNQIWSLTDGILS